jgi:type VI secretion system protein ImpE
MMTPSELFQAGKLAEALAVATDGVKKHPADTARRGWLADVLCFQGEWERADKQFDAISTQDSQVAVAISLIRQLIRAETARSDFYKLGRPPEVLADVTPRMELHLRASLALREGKPAEAAQLLAEADAIRPAVAGTHAGEPFDDLRDLDDLNSSYFELLTSTGKYYWVPYESVQIIEFRKPERPRDLLWRRARMVVNNGPDGEVYLPAIYPVTAEQGDDGLRLGRATDWRQEPGGPVRGVGQRMLLVGNEAKSIMALETIEFRQ